MAKGLALKLSAELLRKEGKNLQAITILTGWLNKNIENFINSAPPEAKYLVAAHKVEDDETTSISITYFKKSEHVKKYMQENPISVVESINPKRTWP